MQLGKLTDKLVLLLIRKSSTFAVKKLQIESHSQKY